MPKYSDLSKVSKSTIDKNRRLAWRKYFQAEKKIYKERVLHYYRLIALEEELDKLYSHLDNQDNRTIPVHFKNQFKELLAASKKSVSCPICLNIIATEKLKVTNCGHLYCDTCLAQINKCAVCRRVLTR